MWKIINIYLNDYLNFTFSLQIWKYIWKPLHLESYYFMDNIYIYISVCVCAIILKCSLHQSRAVCNYFRQTKNSRFQVTLYFILHVTLCFMKDCQMVSNTWNSVTWNLELILAQNLVSFQIRLYAYLINCSKKPWALTKIFSGQCNIGFLSQNNWKIEFHVNLNIWNFPSKKYKDNWV